MQKIEIMLDKASLIENGTIKTTQGTNKVLVTLHNVQSPIQSLMSTRDAEFEDNSDYDFTQELSEKPHLLTLFRADVYDKAYLEVEITTIAKATTAAKVVYKLLKGVSEKVIEKYVPGGEIVTGAAKAISEAAFESLEPEDNVQVIAYGLKAIDQNIINQGALTIPLIVPKKVKMTKATHQRRPGQQKGMGVKKYEEKVIDKGTDNGVMSFKVKPI